MKSFAPKPWVVPMPVLIIGTYNEDGTPNAMNAAWSGQWDMKEIMISMGSHVTTKNLDRNGEFTVAFATKNTMVASDFVGIVSAKNDPKKMEKAGWNIEKATMVGAPVFTDFPGLQMAVVIHNGKPLPIAVVQPASRGVCQKKLLGKTIRTQSEHLHPPAGRCLICIRPRHCLKIRQPYLYPSRFPPSAWESVPGFSPNGPGPRP